MNRQFLFNLIVSLTLTLFSLCNVSCNRTILGDSQRHLYDNFKRSYSEMLYRWGFLVNRTKVLKYLSSTNDTFRGVEFVTECIKCQKVTQAPMCRDCHKPLLYCSLCRLPVRGSGMFGFNHSMKLRILYTNDFQLIHAYFVAMVDIFYI